MRSEYPSFRELIQFRNQYTVTQNLNSPGIIRPYSLENYQHGFALIMEDFGGVSLKEYMNSECLKISEFLPIAIQITNILHQLYQNRVIHKDIKPANILINPDTKKVKLIDFSIASLLPKETQQLQNPNILEGTLAYFSPEQTGRMNRGIDYRSDFYALGITFYELLTGQLPFSGSDPLELIHAHIACNPPKVHEIHSHIPLILSEIVAKLMAKNAEDRYQTALGLKHDLEICWEQWKTHQNINFFEIGHQDICDRFIIPEKLYGRQGEVNTLLEAFNRVATAKESNTSNQLSSHQGRAEMILVAGYSGIGKTAIVNEVHKPIVRQRGYFISGKFDQFQRNIPFSALVQAFQDLIEQLLSETEQQLQQWKIKILEALGDSGQVIIDVIPALKFIIGQQPAVPKLSGDAAQNRFNLLFQKFIRVFATQDHPLVMFLDDLQWVDSASLKFIQLLMTQADTQHLLLIGAYRDNEVDSTHSLALALEEIKQNQGIINTIYLGALRLHHELNPLVADTLRCSPELSLPLSKIIYKKTKGNPFFIIQFLKALYEEGLIAFNLPTSLDQEEQKKIVGGWQCDLAQVKLLSLTEDVVEFVANRLKKLNFNTQQVLKKAACIGNQFDLETLAIVHEKSLTETATDLWVALQEGLILPLTEVYKFYTTEQNTSTRPLQAINPSVSYKFLHDRIQQAAYSLILDEQKQETHLKIGRLLLKKISDSEQEEKLFDIVNQLNIGADLIADQAERNQLAHLNLQAGRKAKASTAYKAAIDYLSTGLNLLETNCWQTQYQLTLDLLLDSADSHYLMSDFAAATHQVDQILMQSNDLLDQCEAYEIQIRIYIAKLKTKEAIHIALNVLEMLDIQLKSELSESVIIEDLVDLPTMTAPDKLAAMRILMTVIPAAYVVQPELLLPITVTMVQLSIQDGNSPISAFAYVFYGVLLCGVTGDIESGYRFGKLSLKVLDKFEEVALKCKVYHLFGAMVKPWKKEIDQANQLVLESIQIGLDTGDIEYASYSIADYCNYQFLIGKSLDSVIQTYDQYLGLTSHLKQTDLVNNCINIWSQIPRSLTGQNSDFLSIIINELSEDEMIQWLEQSNQMISVFATYFSKSLLCYLFHHYEAAVKQAQQAEQYLNCLVGKTYSTQHSFYYSLALLSLAHKTEIDQRQSYLQQVAAHQEKLKKWADHAPMNFLHKFYLVEAEKHRVLGNFVEAMELYDRAIALAKDNEYLHEEALANELAAQFYLNWGKETIAQAYLTQAYYNYARWGAKAKVEDLEKRHPELLKLILNPQKSMKKPANYQIENTISFTDLESSALLDFKTVMKASQAISGAVALEKLLAILMQVTLENAGAQKGILLLSQGNQWLLEAQAQRHFNDTDNFQVKSLQKIPLDSSSDLPHSLIYYVARTRKTLVLDDAVHGSQFANDSYLLSHQPKSIIVSPIINRNQLIGILYLENNLTLGAFTQDRVKVIKILTTQAAISLENARLYDNLTSANQQLEEYNSTLENKVAERTEELHQKNQDLSHALKQLQQTQAQLIQTEKLSSLGQMVAGIAHEINNPVGFISGNVQYAQDYINDLLEVISVYQKEYPNPTPKIEEVLIDVEVDFLVDDLQKLLGSMKEGADRIKKIVQALRTFSRLDESEFKQVDLHEGLESTLVILQNRLKPTSKHPEIQITRHYSNIPKINCYASQLNQVFFNLLSNAIDALEDACKNSLGEDFKPEITIDTEYTSDHTIKVRILDNGCGMDTHLQQKIFDPFFTTKSVGSGTGLGLSVAYSIVVEKHGGELSCRSIPNNMTEFVIEIPVK
jgi:predicted ATPase/signal transduction histidine kinase